MFEIEINKHLDKREKLKLFILAYLDFRISIYLFVCIEYLLPNVKEGDGTDGLFGYLLFLTFEAA